MKYTTYFYSGLSNTLFPNEFELLKNACSRFRNHKINHYTLPKIQGETFHYDELNTLENGWDHGEDEVIKRYLDIFEYGNIGNVLFNMYGWCEDSKLITEQEEIYKHFLHHIKKLNKDITIAPIISVATPRNDLPIKLPLETYGSENRFGYTSFKSITTFALYLLETYFVNEENRKYYYTIDSRPVLTFFDLTRLTLRSKLSLTKQKTARILKYIRKESIRRFGVNPYIIATENDLNDHEETKKFDIDAISAYNALPMYLEQSLRMPIQNYKEIVTIRIEEIKNNSHTGHKPYIPGVSVGFDSTPRVAVTPETKKIKVDGYASGYWYPLVPVIPWKNENPSVFAQYLRTLINHVKENNLPFINIGPFNEITQQCTYLPYFDEKKKKYNQIYLDTLRNEHNLAFSTV